MTEDLCPGSLSCSSKGKKSMKMSISAGKKYTIFTEHLLAVAFFAEFIQTQKRYPTFLDNISILN